MPLIFKPLRILFFILSPFFLGAFNWVECKKIYELQFLGISTSSTMAASSWGRCSLIGLELEDKKEAFYVMNKEVIRSEIARGSGGSLETYLTFSEVATGDISFVCEKLKDRYSTIYPNENLVTEAERFQILNNLIASMTAGLAQAP